MPQWLIVVICTLAAFALVLAAMPLVEWINEKLGGGYGG